MSIWVPTVALEKKKYVEKDRENAAGRALRAKKKKTTSDRASRAWSCREEETRARKRCSNRKNTFQRANFFSFWSQTAFTGFEKASVAQEFDKLNENTTAENPLQYYPTLILEKKDSTQLLSTVSKETTISDSSYQNNELECLSFRKGYQAPTRDFLDFDSKVLFFLYGWYSCRVDSDDRDLLQISFLYSTL